MLRRPSCNHLARLVLRRRHVCFQQALPWITSSFFHSAVLSYAAYATALCFSLAVASRLITLSLPWDLASVTLNYVRGCHVIEPQIDRYHGSPVLGVAPFRLNAALSSHRDSLCHTKFFRRTAPTACFHDCLHDFGRCLGDLALVLPVQLLTS